MKRFLIFLFFVSVAQFSFAQQGNCDMPEITSINGGDALVCAGTNVTLTVAGSLNDATSWEWYVSDCGGTTIAAGVSIVVQVDLTTTYFVRGIGGCVENTAMCMSKEIAVHEPVPEIICPIDIQVINDDGACGAMVSYDLPVASDNCFGIGSVSLTSGLGSGSFFPVGVTTETYTVTNDAGNSVSCSFTITVSDTEKPLLECPADIVMDNDPGECGAIVTYEAPAGSDNCPGPTTMLTAGLGSGAFFPVGETIETYTITDTSGNSAECSFMVTVFDVELPVITVSDASIALWPPNHKHHKINILDYVEMITDNCPGVGSEDIIIDMVTSDEPQNDKGDGNTLNDILFSEDCQTVELLAERKGGETRQIGNGRVYTIHLAVADTSGNIGVASFIAHVPHDMGKNSEVVDNGVSYELNGCDIDIVEDSISNDPEGRINPASIQTFPNPFSETLRIQYLSKVPDNIRVTVYSLTGTKVKDIYIGNVEGNKTYDWSFSANGLKKGLYILKVNGKKSSSSNRLILGE